MYMYSYFCLLTLCVFVKVFLSSHCTSSFLSYLSLKVMSSSPLVATAAVLLLDNTPCHSLLSSLVAVIVLNDWSLDEVQVRSRLNQELSSRLPSAAIPDKMVFVDELPMNSHGELYVYSMCMYTIHTHTVFARSDAVAGIYFVHQICAATSIV